MHRALRAPLLTTEVAEQVGIDDVRLISHVEVTVIEDGLQVVDEVAFAPHQLGEPHRVVRHGEGIVPRTALVEAGHGLEVFTLLGVERLKELADGGDGTHCSGGFVIVALVAHRPRVKQLIVVVLAQSLGQLAERPVGDVVLQSMRDGVVILLAERDVAAPDIVVVVRAYGVVLARGGCRLAHGLVCEVYVKAPQPPEPRVGDDGQRRVALHGECLAPVEFPSRQPSPFLVHAEHGIDHVHLTVREDESVEDMDVAVGVPQRKDRIAVSISHADAVALHHRILAIDILQDVGVYLQMIHGRIEDRLLFVSPTCDTYLRECLVPAVAGCCPDLVEVEGRLFGLEVLPCILDAYKRDGHLHLHLLTLGSIIGEPHSYVVARYVFAVLLVDLIFPMVGIPLGLDTVHWPLLLPVARSLGSLIDPHGEIDGIDRLGIIIEVAEQFGTLYLGVTDEADGST